jgi:putative transposase
VKRVVLTYRYRIKDETTAKRLRAHARAVNYVWNYCCEIQEAARRQEKRWPSAFDLMKLTTGSSALLGLHSKTVHAVCKQFVANRNAARRRPHWRGKKSLGWIPFAAARAVKLDGDAVIYLKRRYRIWRSRPVDGKIKTGCFAGDARGRWYLSLHVEIAESQTCGAGEIGIDLGLSTLATLSDGRKIENPPLQEIQGHAGQGAARRQQETRTGYSRQDRQCASVLLTCPDHEVGAGEPPDRGGQRCCQVFAVSIVPKICDRCFVV